MSSYHVLAERELAAATQLVAGDRAADHGALLRSLQVVVGIARVRGDRLDQLTNGVEPRQLASLNAARLWEAVERAQPGACLDEREARLAAACLAGGARSLLAHLGAAAWNDAERARGRAVVDGGGAVTSAPLEGTGTGADGAAYPPDLRDLVGRLRSGQQEHAALGELAALVGPAMVANLVARGMWGSAPARLRRAIGSAGAAGVELAEASDDEGTPVVLIAWVLAETVDRVADMCDTFDRRPPGTSVVIVMRGEG
ncbi:hypothetical protein [Streptomyces zagrosensis]|uniref:Uncharacterized protein n=1 Tax=Streptomyces zagrosensis TaxID=1042984 RepID=A0A7W9Q5G1_9ACTN|nr:hypothetical protein [Streptomyces zagrosensis]MBB5933983.1 hypothetical protein [Streptomyces zagrosensis]